jgi:hypothetical protein
VVDPSKLSNLTFIQRIGGDNFRFQLRLRYGLDADRTLGPYGPDIPDEKAVATISVPVVVFENYRFEVGKLEVRVWRA